MASSDKTPQKSFINLQILYKISNIKEGQTSKRFVATIYKPAFFK